MINNNMEQAKYWMWARRKINTRPVPPSIFNQESWEEQAFAEDSALLGGCIWPPRSYSCSFCRREFRSAQALGGHMNVHRRDRARLKQSCSPSEEVSEQYTEEGGALEYYGIPIPTSPSPKPNPNPILGFVGSSFCSPSLYTSSKRVEETHLLNPRSLMKNNNPLPILLQSGLELKLGFGSYLKGKRDRDGGYDHDDDDDRVCNNNTKRRKIDDDQEVLHSISSKQNSGELQIIRGPPVEEIDLELRLGSDPLKVK